MSNETIERDAYGSKVGTRSHRMNEVIMSRPVGSELDHYELAEQAGVTPRVMYNHFIWLESKDCVEFVDVAESN